MQEILSSAVGEERRSEQFPVAPLKISKDERELLKSKASHVAVPCRLILSCLNKMDSTGVVFKG